MKNFFCKYKKYIIIILLIIIIIPIILEFFIFRNNFYSPVSNDGWASFFGSFLGGIFGGILTLIGVWITIKSNFKLYEDSLLKSKRVRLSFSRGEDTLLLANHFETFDRYEVFGHGKWIDNLRFYYSTTSEDRNKIIEKKHIVIEKWIYFKIDNLTDNTLYNSQITISFLKNNINDSVKVILDVIAKKSQYLMPIGLCEDIDIIESIEIIGESEVGEFFKENISFYNQKINRKREYGLDESILDYSTDIIVSTPMVKKFIEKKNESLRIKNIL